MNANAPAGTVSPAIVTAGVATGSENCNVSATVAPGWITSSSKSASVSNGLDDLMTQSDPKPALAWVYVVGLTFPYASSSPAKLHSSGEFSASPGGTTHFADHVVFRRVAVAAVAPAPASAAGTAAPRT